MLDAAASSVATQRSTGKEPLTDHDVRQLLASADTVIIARGRGRREMPAAETELDALKGPTGSYRAPMLLTDRTLVVGFNAEALGELLAG